MGERDERDLFVQDTLYATVSVFVGHFELTSETEREREREREKERVRESKSERKKERERKICLYIYISAQEWTNRTLISHEPLICSKMCFTKTESVH